MKLDSVKEQPPEDMDPDIWQLVQQFQQYIGTSLPLFISLGMLELSLRFQTLNDYTV